MATSTASLADVLEALSAVREELTRLNERVVVLEGTGRAAATTPVATAPAPEAAASQPAELSEELVLVLSSAIAAYLGKRPFIRQIRLMRSDAWAQEGRITIQASHALNIKHG